MEYSRQQIIADKAINLAREAWAKWRPGPASDVRVCDQFLCDLPMRLIREHFSFSLNQPTYVPPASVTEPVTFEVAGVLDVDAKRITVAGKHPFAWRRFTMAHEIGHLVLHAGRPNMKLHRDRPLTGGELCNEQRSPLEHEADYFAAQLLMPPQHVKKLFAHYFGKPIDTTSHLEHLASLLSYGLSKPVRPSDLARKGRPYIAFLVAQAQSFGKTIGTKEGTFTSLASRLHVSPSAMGYQLEHLQLVR